MQSLVSRVFRNVQSTVNQLLFHQYCLIGDHFLNGNETLVCHNCLDRIPSTPSPHLPESWTPGQSPLTHVFSYWDFQEDLQQVIHAMKYQQKPSLGAILAEYILEQMTPDWLPKIDFVIPIPLHPAKQRDRGYNQAAAIARAIATKRQIPVKEEGLQRVKFTRTQTKLTREERRDNMIGAFQLQDGNTLENSAVLLVDDVFTTGSTMESAAHTLQSHGIIAVYGFTLAAAPLHDRS